MENGMKSHFQNLNTLPKHLLYVITDLSTRSRFTIIPLPKLTLRDRGLVHAIAKLKLTGLRDRELIHAIAKHKRVTSTSAPLTLRERDLLHTFANNKPPYLRDRGSLYVTAKNKNITAPNKPTWSQTISRDRVEENQTWAPENFSKTPSPKIDLLAVRNSPEAPKTLAKYTNKS